eukprot:TRINITY_DN6470_c0_g1_i1.p1 TRINITY_DN6470_c0_g1~~TRINITY_DN6470_c0_g1_i1.p1  ORF type:complete len:184 (+),score=19.24 TRINITY_DN6470_c0_g1_i1:21-572(+)
MYSRIIHRLYLGNLDNAHNEQGLRKKQITHIVTLTSSSFPPKFPKEFEYLWVNVEDECLANLLSTFQTVFRFVDRGRRRGNVLVHCGAGVSRSATIVIAYLMYKRPEKFKTHNIAMDFVRQKRKIISPNKGFIIQLKVYQEAKKNDESTSSLAVKEYILSHLKSKPKIELWSKSTQTKEVVVY